MIHVLWSQTNVDEFGSRVPDLLRKKNIDMKLVHVPDDGSAISAADLQNLEVACATCASPSRASSVSSRPAKKITTGLELLVSYISRSDPISPRVLAMRQQQP